MQKLIFTILAITTCHVLSAQQETLFQDLDVNGAFGGPYIEISRINGEVGSSTGGGGALVLSHLFIGGYGQRTKFAGFNLQNTSTGGTDFYDSRFGHGGLWFGLVPKQYKLVHFYSSLKVGWGKADLIKEGDDKKDRIRDRIFALTPEIGFEVNLTDFLKLSLSGGYRWINGISRLPTLDNDDFSSPIGIITFRIGGFDEGNFDWNW